MIILLIKGLQIGNKFAYIFLNIEKMVPLNRQEIVAELRRLGVNNPSERTSLFKEYQAYRSFQKTFFAEKRSFERIPIGEEVKISYKNKYYSGTVLNISEEGMFLGTKKCLPFNSTLSIENKLFKVLVSVKRLTEMNGYYDGVGVKLTNPTEVYSEFINGMKSSL
jgi:hypothetical protein